MGHDLGGGPMFGAATRAAVHNEPWERVPGWWWLHPRRWFGYKWRRAVWDFTSHQEEVHWEYATDRQLARLHLDETFNKDSSALLFD